MTPERYQKIATLFHAALELPPSERNDYLRQACEGDEQLKIEVTKLLDESEEVGDFLDVPAFMVAAEALADEKSQSFIGKRLGRFEILSLLGVGGMGEVYLAQDTQLGRRVALKLLPREFTSQTDRLRRFEREARAASALNHPNIITIHDIGKASGIHFIATEYIEGEMLRKRIGYGRLPVAEAIEIALQVANALEVAHSAGIIHRDIKPENIMLRPDGYVKVLDFGLAKLNEPKQQPPGTSQIDSQWLSHATSAGMIIGTVNYMSPEQARGLPVDRRCDLWSLGVTLYEMVAGKSPFTGQTMTDIIVSIVDRQPQPLTQVIPELPVELERIVMKTLAKNCDERYQSAKDLGVDLKNLRRQFESSSTFTLPQNPDIDSAKAPNDRHKAQGLASPKHNAEHLTVAKALQKTEGFSEAKTALIKKPVSKPAIFMIAGLVLIIAGSGIWLVFRPNSPAPVSAPASTSTPAPMVPAASERQISYGLTITPEGAQTYQASGQEVFKRNDRFSFTFSSPQDGFIYLLNEENDKNGSQFYSMLFPIPSSNNGSAQLSGNQSITTGRYTFDPGKSIENVILVWAARPVDELEAVKHLVNPQDKGEIKAPLQLAAVKKFLEQYQQSTTEATLNQSSRQTMVRGSGDILIHPFKLTHQ